MWFHAGRNMTFCVQNTKMQENTPSRKRSHIPPGEMNVIFKSTLKRGICDRSQEGILYIQLLILFSKNQCSLEWWRDDFWCLRLQLPSYASVVGLSKEQWMFFLTWELMEHYPLDNWERAPKKEMKIFQPTRDFRGHVSFREGNAMIIAGALKSRWHGRPYILVYCRTLY